MVTSDFRGVLKKDDGIWFYVYILDNHVYSVSGLPWLSNIIIVPGLTKAKEMFFSCQHLKLQATCRICIMIPNIDNGT